MATLIHCMDRYPIFDTLLSYLSATDSSSLLGITGKLYQLSDAAKAQYMDIRKDLPEYAPWVRLMLSRGHTLLLVGTDLKGIQESYKYPLSYWKEHNRRQQRTLWLVSLTMKMYKDGYRNTDIRMPMVPAMNEVGNVQMVAKYSAYYFDYYHCSTHCPNVLCSPDPLSLSINMPPPGRWSPCTAGRMKKDQWLPLSIDSDSNILLLYLQSDCRNERLFTQLCEPYATMVLGDKLNLDSPTQTRSVPAAYMVPYMNIGSGRTNCSSMTIHQSIGFEVDTRANTQWDVDSDYNTFSIAFYRNISYKEALPGIMLDDDYEVASLEFVGLDPEVSHEC